MSAIVCNDTSALIFPSNLQGRALWRFHLFIYLFHKIVNSEFSLQYWLCRTYGRIFHQRNGTTANSFGNTLQTKKSAVHCLWLMHSHCDTINGLGLQLAYKPIWQPLVGYHHRRQLTGSPANKQAGCQVGGIRYICLLVKIQWMVFWTICWIWHNLLLDWLCKIFGDCSIFFYPQCYTHGHL